ncbi:hypothetical protein [Pseudomonas fluorescens]|nr:hypothetical protein [Pseudomonas fluorescens]
MLEPSQAPGSDAALAGYAMMASRLGQGGELGGTEGRLQQVLLLP